MKANSDKCTVLFFLLVMTFSHIHQGHLAVDAIKYAHMSREILVTGNWMNLVDSYNGSAYANKPPVLFWMLAIIFKTFGFSTFIAKLIPAIFAFLTGLMFYLIGLRFSQKAGLYAVFLFAFNRSFAKDIVDLGFDSMSTLGMVLILYWALLLIEQAKQQTNLKQQIIHGLLLGSGVSLVSLSKPPYLAFTFLPLLYLFFKLDITKSIRSIFIQIFCLLIMLSPNLFWFLNINPSYIEKAYDNQVYEQLELKRTFWLNFLIWVRSYFATLGPASWAFLFATRAIFKKNSRTIVENFLLIWSWQMIAVILFIACRPRYLWPVFIPAILLGADYLSNNLIILTEKRLRQILLSLSGILLLCVAFDVKLHRNNQLLEAFNLQNEKVKQDNIWFCLDDENPIHQKRAHQQLRLLVELELDQNYPIISSSGLKEKKAFIIANKLCAKRAEGQGLIAKRIFNSAYMIKLESSSSN